MKSDNKLVRFLHNLSRVDKENNSTGSIKITNIDSFISILNDYQNEVVHDLSQGKVINNNLTDLLETNRIIYDLRKTKFEDEGVPQLLLDLYQDNLKVLGNLDKKLLDSFDTELDNKAIDNATTLDDYYHGVLTKELKATIKKYNEDELKQVDKLAKDDISALLLGIPYESIERVFASGEERLCNNLQSIYDEAKNNNQKTQSLSKLPFDYKKNKGTMEQDLDNKLNAVSNCLIRNNEAERLISMRNKTKRAM